MALVSSRAGLRLALVLAAACIVAMAQPEARAQALPGSPSMPDVPERFPSAAMTLLETEMPAMEAAVADRDRKYFENAMGRVLDFSDRWGYKSRDNPLLARYATCTDAVADFLVVGLCRFPLSPETCQPSLKAEFENNLQRCRDLAGRR